jgi:hypothetical protein
MVTKKVVLGAGGLTTVLAVLLYLSTLPGVTITTSGDINCWGTAANPCISYFNITSSIYTLKFFNTSEQKLTFSPDVKDYKIYRFTSSKWKEVNFPINMTKGVLYQFKLIGYKNNPGDNVKWGVQTGDVYLDPYWFGMGTRDEVGTPTSNMTINTTWLSYNKDGYDYVMNQSVYTMYAKTNSNWGDGIKYCVNQSCLVYQSSDYSYRDVYGSQDYISNIQNVQGIVTNDRISYNNTYPGVNLTFQTFATKLKETYVIASKPRAPAAYLTAPVTLDFGGYIKFGSLDVYVNNVSMTGKDFVTNSSIEFRSGNVSVFWLPVPYATDSNTSMNSTINLQYEVKKSGSQIWFYVRTPYSWLNDSARVYPVFIDPTTDTIGDTAYNQDLVQGIAAQAICGAASASGTLQTAGVNFAGAGDGVTVHIGFYNSTAGRPSNRLASATVNTAVGWVDVDLSSGSIAIVQGTNYCVGFFASKEGSSQYNNHTLIGCQHYPVSTLPIVWNNTCTGNYVPNVRFTYGTAAEPVPVYLGGLSNITYGTSLTPYCYSTAACTLLRNGSVQSNNTAITLDIGNWNYTANETGGNSTQSWVVVSKAPTNMTLWINGTSGNFSGTYPTFINATGKANITGDSVTHFIIQDLETESATDPTYWESPLYLNDTIWTTAGYMQDILKYFYPNYTIGTNDTNVTFIMQYSFGENCAGVCGINVSAWNYTLGDWSLWMNMAPVTSDGAPHNTTYTISSPGEMGDYDDEGKLVLKVGARSSEYVVGVTKRASIYETRVDRRGTVFTGAVELWHNTTLMFNATTTAWNITLWQAGMHNFSAYFRGNSTHLPSNETYWANISKSATGIQVSPLTQSITFEDLLNQNCTTNSTVHKCSLWRGLSSTPTINITSLNNTNEMLNATVWYFNATVEGSQNYSTASTSIQTVTVIKKAFTFGLSPPNGTITYYNLSYENATSNGTVAGSQLTIWRNNTNITAMNGTSERLPPGYWTFVANSTQPTANYSWTSILNNVTVNKNTTTIHLALDGIEGNKTIIYPSTINATAWKTASLGNFTILRNGTIFNFTTSLDSITNYTIPNVGIYNYTAVFNHTNYTAPSVTWWLTDKNVSTIIDMPFQKLYPLENSTTDSNRSTTLWDKNWNIISGGFYSGAVSNNRSTNNASQSKWNETFTTNENKTFWVILPKQSTVINARLNLSGYPTAGDCVGCKECAYTPSSPDCTCASPGSGGTCTGGCAQCAYTPTSSGSPKTCPSCSSPYSGTVNCASCDVTFYNPFALTYPTCNCVSGWVGGGQNGITCYACYASGTPYGNGCNFPSYPCPGACNLLCGGPTCNTYPDCLSCTSNACTYTPSSSGSCACSAPGSGGSCPGGCGECSYIPSTPTCACTGSYTGGGCTSDMNPYLSVSGDTVWSFIGNFSQMNNRTANFSSSVQKTLLNCTANAAGNCNVSMTIHLGMAGIIQVSDITINYTTNVALTELPRYSWYKFNVTGLPYFDNATLNVYQQQIIDSAWGGWCGVGSPCMTEIYYSPNQTWKQPLSWDNKTNYDNYVLEKRNVTSSEGWNIWTVTEHLRSVFSNATFMLRIPQLNIGLKAMNLTSSQNATYKPYLLANVTKYLINATSCIGNTTCYQNGTFTPKGQSASQWIFNITPYGSDSCNVTVSWNASLPGCMTHYLSLNSTFEPSVDFNVSNTTPQTILSNITVLNGSFPVWGFFKLNNCTAGVTTNSSLNFTVVP